MLKTTTKTISHYMIDFSKRLLNEKGKYKGYIDAPGNVPRFSSDMEEAYQDYRYKKLIQVTPLTAIAGIAFFAIFVLLDLVYLPETVWNQTVTIRMFINVPLVGLCILAAYRKWGLQGLQNTILVAYMAGGLGVAAVVHAALKENVYLPHDGFLLLLVFGYFLLHMSFFKITLASCFISLAYLNMYSHTDLPDVEIYLVAFFVLSFNLMGMFGSYLQEQRQRSLFWNEMKLAESREKDQQEIAYRTRLLATASHDLRQPIHAMNLMIDMLRERPEESADNRVADKLKGSLAQLNRLLGSVLSISQLNTGVMEVKTSQFNIKELLSDLLDEEQDRFDEKGVQILLECDERIWVETDATLLSRILRNIMHNTYDHAQSSFLRFRIKPLAEDRIELIVEDDGRGIKPSEVESLFEEFTKGDSENKTGLGLGLSIVKQLSDLLGLNMVLDTDVEKGCRYRFEIKSEPPSSQKQTIHHERSSELMQGTILVFEDDLNILNSMESVLKGWGLSVIAVSDIDSALASNRLSQVDLIISDFHLNDNQTGLNAISKTRSMVNRLIPAVIVTADTSITNESLLEQQEDADLDELVVLHKPVQAAKLKLAVRHLLR